MRFLPFLLAATLFGSTAAAQPNLRLERSVIEQVRSECQAEADEIIRQVVEEARRQGGGELHFTWEDEEGKKTGSTEQFVASFVRQCMKDAMKPAPPSPPAVPA